MDGVDDPCLQPGDASDSGSSVPSLIDRENEKDGVANEENSSNNFHSEDAADSVSDIPDLEIEFEEDLIVDEESTSKNSEGRKIRVDDESVKIGNCEKQESEGEVESEEKEDSDGKMNYPPQLVDSSSDDCSEEGVDDDDPSLERLFAGKYEDYAIPDLIDINSEDKRMFKHRPQKAENSTDEEMPELDDDHFVSPYSGSENYEENRTPYIVNQNHDSYPSEDSEEEVIISDDQNEFDQYNYKPGFKPKRVFPLLSEDNYRDVIRDPRKSHQKKKKKRGKPKPKPVVLTEAEKKEFREKRIRLRKHKEKMMKRDKSKIAKIPTIEEFKKQEKKAELENSLSSTSSSKITEIREIVKDRGSYLGKCVKCVLTVSQVNVYSNDIFVKFSCVSGCSDNILHYECWKKYFSVKKFSTNPKTPKNENSENSENSNKKISVFCPSSNCEKLVFQISHNLDILKNTKSSITTTENFQIPKKAELQKYLRAKNAEMKSENKKKEDEKSKKNEKAK